VFVTGSQAIAIPLNTTAFASGVSIYNGTGIRFASAGKYDIQFSAQMQNDATNRRTVTIWLSKNGTDSSSWIANTSTDFVLGSSADAERVVAAWNYFVDASANDYFVIMIASSGSSTGKQVTIHAGASQVNPPSGIPAIPSTIVTVNQVG
jgi:hypothetical protein